MIRKIWDWLGFLAFWSFIGFLLVFLYHVPG